VAALQRLLDVTPLFETDLRIQTVYAVGDGGFSHSVADVLRELRAVVVPWEQATQESFALVLTSGYSGVHELRSPVLAIAHGAGRNKRISPSSGHLGLRIPTLYGLSQQQLVRDGRLVVSALGLSHARELAVLEETCPEAVPSALVIGDPCFDRILTGVSRRSDYRHSIGIAGDEKLLVMCSTWGRHSLFGSRFDILDSVAKEAQPGKLRVALMLHPAVWYGHGRRQVEAWLERLRSRGLIVVDPDLEWRSLLIAADWVLGDHGSTSLYAAAAGASFIHVDFPSEVVAPDSPIAWLHSAATRWSDSTSAVEQFSAIESERARRVAEETGRRITSCPGNSAALMRRAIYGYMPFEEPTELAALPLLPAPLTSLYQGGPGSSS
jgi:hypothetical protein